MVILKRIALCALALAATLSCVGQKDDGTDPPEQPSNPSHLLNYGASLILDFTATWCVNCPRMASAIEEAAKERPGEILLLSVHFQDEFACDDGKALIERFGVQAYPSVVVDMDPSTLTTATSKDLILARMDESKALRKAPCKLVMNSVKKAEAMEVSVAVTASEEGTYHLCVARLRNGVQAPQTGGSDNYMHHNIFLGFLQEEGVDGAPLGNLAAGEEATWTGTTPAENPDDFLIAFVLEEDGRVNTAGTAQVIRHEDK